MLLLLAAPNMASGNFITSPEEFSHSAAADFTWQDARSKSIKIILEYLDRDEIWQRVNLGSGFLLSPDGIFVTAYHVMKYCLAGRRDSSGHSVQIDCSALRNARYVAVNGTQEFPIEVVAHLTESDSTKGKDHHSPDEIIKQRDFVVAKLVADPSRKFDFWRLRDFDQSRIDLSNPSAEFTLMPLLPPKRVFIAGFPSGHDFVVSEGFLNLTEKNHRGYFAADMAVYSPAYLDSQGVARDTRWGMRIDNHMSGGAVVDSAGYVVGLVVNGDRKTAGVLSIENVLATFFSKNAGSKSRPAMLLEPNRTPLFLKRDADDEGTAESSEPELLSRAPDRLYPAPLQ